MAVRNLNEYRVTFEDNTDTAFMAENARAVTKILETDQRPIVQLSRIKVGIGVETPVRNVKFVVTVMPEGAGINKCKAVPDTWVVPEGTSVIFTAMPSDGYRFDGWFKKGEAAALSTDIVAELTVEYPADPAAMYEEFEARFSPIPAPGP